MPLRAILNDSPIQAFELDSESWLKLKGQYKTQSLTMACCGHKAIPKTSKLGTQHFAHAKRGECSSAPETADHLKLKTIVAQVATEAGWQVTTEYNGETPTGEAWVADVFCQKGKSKLVFEIQWSHQSYDEYERRTRKYLESGIARCAWLYRSYKNRDNQLPESKEMPCFGLTGKDGYYEITKFEIDVATFVQGMFQRKLKWQPENGEEVVGYAYYNESRCLKCGEVNNYFCAMDTYSKEGALLNQELYYSYGVSDAQIVIEKNISPDELRKHLIGSLDHKYNKKGDYAYMAHGCLHCNGVHCNHTYRYDYHSDKKRAIRFTFQFERSLMYVEPKWCFVNTGPKMLGVTP